MIYLNTYSDEAQQVFQAAQTAGCPLFTLVAISDLDWNHDMALWESPTVFKGGESFTGGAGNHLRLVDAVFQLNPGNHDHRAAKRTAAGITWLLSR